MSFLIYNIEPKTPSIDFSELHNICRSSDLHRISKFQNALSGSRSLSHLSLLLVTFVPALFTANTIEESIFCPSGFATEKVL